MRLIPGTDYVPWTILVYGLLNTDYHENSGKNGNVNLDKSRILTPSTLLEDGNRCLRPRRKSVFQLS